MNLGTFSLVADEVAGKPKEPVTITVTVPGKNEQGESCTEETVLKCKAHPSAVQIVDYSLTQLSGALANDPLVLAQAFAFLAGNLEAESFDTFEALCRKFEIAPEAVHAVAGEVFRWAVGFTQSSPPSDSQSGSASTTTSSSGGLLSQFSMDLKSVDELDLLNREYESIT
jgi:hypothetical protein